MMEEQATHNFISISPYFFWNRDEKEFIEKTSEFHLWAKENLNSSYIVIDTQIYFSDTNDKTIYELTWRK